MTQLLARLRDIDEQWKILSIAISILVFTGVTPSYFTNDWEWFSRSGALLVVFGIYVVWRDIKGGIHSALNQVEESASAKFGEKSAELSRLIKNIQRRNRKLYDTIEFLILAVGTIISAYGNLINDFRS